VWLSTGAPPPYSQNDGGIWLDRHRRPENYLPTTYRSATNRQRDGDALWQWCAGRALPLSGSGQP
jgi:hypothetical protein